MVKISTTVSGADAAENILIKLPTELNRQMRKAFRSMGNVVVRRARQLVPPPGYPGDKPELTPLRDTLKVEVKEGRQLFAVIGPKAGAGGGPHGHLVEFGHSIVTAAGVDTGYRAEPHPFLEPAAEDTRTRQDKIARNAIIAMDKAISDG